jgi:hypothetical protein
MKQEETWECEEGTQSHILSSGTQVLTYFLFLRFHLVSNIVTMLLHKILQSMKQ